ncbi:MAG: polysaccharide biosynthesis protein [Firmicutes bacterium]|nr:polysaccharide biosynthesis protein [Bacillota bacterium]
MLQSNKRRLSRVLLYVLSDVVFIELALVVSVSLWYTGSIPGSRTTAVPAEAWIWWGRYMAFAAPLISVAVFAAFRMYSNLWKYAGIDEILKIFLATILIFVLLYVYNLVFLDKKGLIELPRRLLFLAWMFDTLLFSFSRFGYRALRRTLVVFTHLISGKAGCKRVLVVGAGFSGYGVVSGMLHSRIRDRIPALIVDDDKSKHNAYILGVRVVNGIDRIREYAEKFGIDEIVVAIPTAPPEEIRAVLEQCTATECSLKILPPMSDVSDGNFSPAMREVSISDLLYREEVRLDTKNISDYLGNRVVLVTGGGGSIGSELCRQIAKFRPKKIVIFDIYENTAYDLISELNDKYGGGLDIEMEIGSVRDMRRLEEVFSKHRPNVVFHTAAHKHVHFVEANPAEAVKNNVLGTQNLAVCADRYGTERFVLISSDKAVNPPNVYGATKRLGELIVQGMAERSGTKFIAVRFGNVLGSNGSIIPKWKRQIAQGGPVTVTHKDMYRFFMTISEACLLVLQASGLGRSGRILVLDMGEPVRIDDLARNYIRLSGYKPDAEIKIEYTGPRPGEKLREELILADEREDLQLTCHKKIFITKPAKLDFGRFEKKLDELYKIAEERPEGVEEFLRGMEDVHYRE